MENHNRDTAHTFRPRKSLLYTLKTSFSWRRNHRIVFHSDRWPGTQVGGVFARVAVEQWCSLLLMTPARGEAHARETCQRDWDDMPCNPTYRDGSLA